MKIRGLSGKTYDTDKMDDLTAETVEKVSEFHQFCIKMGVPICLLYKQPNGKLGIAVNWDDNRKDSNTETRGRIFLDLMGGLNGYLDSENVEYLVAHKSKIIMDEDSNDETNY